MNCDGQIDRKDRIYLARVLADWEGYELKEPSTADTNNDGIISRKDRVYLSRALAGWDGYQL